MVPNPRRYCECIGADVFNDMFCEAPIDPSECVCPAIYDPVTCADGEEYSNSCFAGCVGQTQCRPVVEEPVEEPVDEEESAETEDEAEDETETEEPVDDKADEGEPGDREKPCPCPRIYRPVTCESNVTFPNQCLATCAGQRNCRSERQNDEVVFDRSDFVAVIEEFQDRPTGLGVDDRRGAYTDLVSEYDNAFNRPTGLGDDDEKSAETEETEANERDEQDAEVPRVINNNDTTR